MSAADPPAPYPPSAPEAQVLPAQPCRAPASAMRGPCAPRGNLGKRWAPCDSLPMRQIKPARPNPYSGGALDRAAHLREDEAYLARAAADPASRVTYVWQGKHLLTSQEAPRAHLLPVPPHEPPALFLGLHEDVPLFAHDLSARPEAPDFGAGEF